MRTFNVSNKETGSILLIAGFISLFTLMYGFENPNWVLKVLCLCVQFLGVYFLIKGMSKKEIRIRVITGIIMLLIVAVYLLYSNRIF
jgi:uncharacterized membrane protein YfcA